MTKNTPGTGPRHAGAATPVLDGAPLPLQRGGSSCDLYLPGHQIHYTHQGQAVHSPSRVTRDALLEDTLLTLVLDDGESLRWRHHDPERLGRMLELLRSRCVVYEDFHALRVGPYWFNCAREHDEWQDCRRAAARGGS
jgi:hypothetical protein